MNIKMITNSQLSTIESKIQKQTQAKQITRTEQNNRYGDDLDGY